MARNKFKLTGFARFFIVMLFLAPLAYIGASYANGEDGIQNFKDLFQGKISMGSNKQDNPNTENESTKPVEIPSPESQASNIDQAELDSKDEKIQSLIEKNIKLQDQIAEKDKELEAKTKELEDVSKQLKAIKDAVGGGSPE